MNERINCNLSLCIQRMKKTKFIPFSEVKPGTESYIYTSALSAPENHFECRTCHQPFRPRKDILTERERELWKQLVDSKKSESILPKITIFDCHQCYWRNLPDLRFKIREKQTELLLVQQKATEILKELSELDRLVYYAF